MTRVATVTVTILIVTMMSLAAWASFTITEAILDRGTTTNLSSTALQRDTAPAVSTTRTHKGVR